MNLSEISLSLIDGVKKHKIGRFRGLKMDNIAYNQAYDMSTAREAQEKEETKENQVSEKETEVTEECKEETKETEDGQEEAEESEDSSDSADSSAMILVNAFKKQPYLITQNPSELQDNEHEGIWDEKFEEMKTVFETKKSYNPSSSFTRHQRNYYHFNFIEGAYFGMTNKNILALTPMLDSIGDHVAQIKGIFYISAVCFNDIAGVHNKTTQIKEIDDSTPFDIDDEEDSKDSKDFDVLQEFQEKHKSKLKIEISVSKIQADLLDEEVPPFEGLLSFSKSKGEDENLSEDNIEELNLDRKSTSRKEDKFALLSVIFERS